MQLLTRCYTSSSTDRIRLHPMIVMFLICGIFMTTPARAENPDVSPDYSEVTSGTLYLHSSAGYVDPPLLESSVSMAISGIIANVTMIQSYSNEGPDWVEGIYVFPLPENAAINAVTIQVGDRTINGRIAEKEAAERTYQNAKDSGRITSVVRQERPNLFTSKIANIAPGSAISVTLKYIQTIDYRDDQFSLRLPLTLTPRYSNQSVDYTDKLNISPPQQHASRHNAIPVTTLGGTLFSDIAVQNLHSPQHELTTRNNGSSTTFELPVATPMNRDFVLTWSLAATTNPAVANWLESVDGTDYLLTMLMPPQEESLRTPLARELILVIDTSGSMAGESIRAATSALSSALDGLNPSDRFNLIAFDSNSRKLFPASVLADRHHLDKARRWIRSLHADGGTEMHAALAHALSNPLEGYLRQAVFITDGSVGNEEALFRQITRHLRNTRLFTVGIGAAPNSYFMKKAAEAGRGTYTWIGAIEDAQAEITQLLYRLQQPALTAIDIDWIDGDADYAPSPVSDLYAGEPIVIAAQLQPGTSGMTVSGKRGDTVWTETVDLTSVPRVTTDLSTIWARRKIEALLDEQRHMRDTSFHKSEITSIAVNHQLVSPYTSFVAVDSAPARVPDSALQSTRISNLMPAGSDMMAINIPAGASGTDTLMAVSLISLILAALFALFDRWQTRQTCLRRSTTCAGAVHVQ